MLRHVLVCLKPSPEKVLLGSTTQAVLAAWRRPLMLCH